MMEMTADLVVELLTLVRLHEISRHLCLMAPMTASAEGSVGADWEGLCRKRKHSDSHCEEQDIGVNELLLKYGRHSGSGREPRLAGREASGPSK